jgi:lysyl-tRNA synthetase class 2
MEVNWRLARRQKALWKRAAIVQGMRRFFIDRGYLEVETPQRIPSPAPESQIDAVPADGWFLQTSPELCMKRLLAAGYERIFQMSHCWRSGERGSLHVPEFTMIEWYRAGANYRDLMEECEALVPAVAGSLHLSTQITYLGQAISLEAPWERISVDEAYRRHAGVSAEQALRNDQFDEVMVRDVEPHLGVGHPTFLYDYPAERGCLARLRADNPNVAERFELYVGGLELANAFSELIDADEQRARFTKEEAYRRSLGSHPYPLASKFLDELHNMPPAAGIALGVDRLVMLLVNAASIDQVLAFTPEDL